MDTNRTFRARRSLRAAWWFAAAVGVAAFLLGGYYGWAAIFAWAVLAVPLTWATLRVLSRQGFRLTRTCIVDALSMAGVVGIATLAVGLSLFWLPPQTPVFFGTLVGMASWIILFGQVVFVGTTTGWMLRQLGAGD